MARDGGDLLHVMKAWPSGWILSDDVWSWKLKIPPKESFILHHVSKLSIDRLASSASCISTSCAEEIVFLSVSLCLLKTTFFFYLPSALFHSSSPKKSLFMMRTCVRKTCHGSHLRFLLGKLPCRETVTPSILSVRSVRRCDSSWLCQDLLMSILSLCLLSFITSKQWASVVDIAPSPNQPNGSVKNPTTDSAWKLPLKHCSSRSSVLTLYGWVCQRMSGIY